MSELVKQYNEEEAKAFLPSTGYAKKDASLSDTGDILVGGIVQEIQMGSQIIGETQFASGNTIFRFGCNQTSKTCPALLAKSHVCGAKRQEGSPLSVGNIICGKIYPQVEMTPVVELTPLVSSLPQ